MALLHDVNGPCMCVHCGSHLPVKLAKGGNSPGHYYIHCIACSYHFTFPKLASPHPLPQPFPPTATHDGLATSRVIDCAKPGCKRRGCIQCPRRMCKQCCVLLPGCSLRSHSFDQLSSKQRGKLAVPAVPTSALNAITAHDPVVLFFEQEKQRAEAERGQDLQAQQLEEDEEEQYQAALAASLAVPRATPHLASSASSSQSPLDSLAPSAPFPSPFPSPFPLAHPYGFSTTPAVPISRPSTKPITTVRTIPYRPLTSKPGIKEHMSEDWMRPVVDNTKKPKRRNRINLDNTFSLIFWHMDGKPPKRRAIHECPLWPKWILLDDVNVREELDIQARLLEYFDTRSLQWITCTPSYPHTVKKDGFLLLRLLGTECLGLDELIQQAITKDTHLRYNMTAERTAIKKQLQQRKLVPPPYLVQFVSKDDEDDEDDAVVFVEQQQMPPKLKRQREDTVDANPRPSERQRSNPESTTTTPLRQHFSPFPRSPTTSSRASPCPSLPTTPIHVPETSKRWPAGMYAIDMSLGFHQVDQSKTLLDESLLNVFGKKIPPNTYRDQRRYWKALTQEQRDTFKNAGRTPAGLWSAVPKRSKVTHP